MPPSAPWPPPRDPPPPDKGAPSPDPGGRARGEWLKREALALGFHRAGIALPPPDPSAAAAYTRWLEQGYHGEMEYLARPDAVARRLDPALTLQDVRSVLVVTHRYAGGGDSPPGPRPGEGHIARYARILHECRICKEQLYKIF